MCLRPLGGKLKKEPTLLCSPIPYVAGLEGPILHAIIIFMGGLPCTGRIAKVVTMGNGHWLITLQLFVNKASNPCLPPLFPF